MSRGEPESSTAKMVAGGSRRRLLVGLALAGLVPPLLVKAEAARLRRKHDPEAGEFVSGSMGEKGRYLESFDGTRLYVEEVGRGPAIVLVHGWFCNTDMWHYQKKELSDRYRIVCFDLRGHRRSGDAGGRVFLLEDLARDLRCVLDACAPDEPVVLVGHSMGGATILKYLEMFGEEPGGRVKGVARGDTTHVPMSQCVAAAGALRAIKKPVVQPAFRWIATHPGFADRVKGLMTGGSLFLVATRYIGFGSGASVTQMEHIGEMVKKTSVEGAFRAALGMLEQEEDINLDSLRDSGIPVFIWVGEKDKLTRPEVSERMCMLLPCSELHVIADTGHPSFMEEYEMFNRALDRLAVKSFAADGR